MKPAVKNALRLTRRHILLGASAAALTSGVRALAGETGAPPLLRAARRTLDIEGKAASVYGLTQRGAQGVATFRAGERFAVTLENRLAEPTLIHWHGLTPPGAQDGTPGLSQEPLAPTASYAYDFPLARPGTFWMHSHVGFQRAKLLAAPLIVRDRAEARRDEQEIVVFLSDFSFREPEEIFAGLTRGQTAIADMPGMDHMQMGHGATGGMRMPMHGRGMAGDMPMGMDVNDIDFDAYLANDRTLADPETVRVEPGGRVRLRIINGAAGTNFWVDLGGLSAELVAVDGDPVLPLGGSRFALAMAQRIDLRLTLPAGEGAYPILALREGAVERTGIVLATRRAPVRKLAKAGAAPTSPLGFALEEKLRAAEPLAERKADRRLVADLTGDMASFAWGINGKRYGVDTPLRVRKGERVELVMRNRTMMAHPMHLHGHRFEVAAIGERRLAGAVRDTVLVPPRASVTVAFDADNPGAWAFHCHNEYHMAAGMMTSLRYEG